MGPLALAAIIGGGQVIGAQLARDAAKRERDNHFVNLRESARRGGFNPLTALRATGGGGYGQYVPLLSRSPLGEGISAGTSFYANMQRDMYFTRENQAHEIALNKMSNSAADRRAAMNANKEFDYAAVKTVAVKFGGKTLNLASDVARRFKLLPGDNLLPGELAEIGGEFWGEVVSALGTEAAAKVLGVQITDLLNTDEDRSNEGFVPTITRSELSSLDSYEVYNSQWFKNVKTALSRSYNPPTFEQQADGWAKESAKYAKQY